MIDMAALRPHLIRTWLFDADDALLLMAKSVQVAETDKTNSVYFGLIYDLVHNLGLSLPHQNISHLFIKNVKLLKHDNI